PEWQGRQLEGVVLPARWKRPPDHEVYCVDPGRWQMVHSPFAVGVEWSNWTPAGSAAFPDVSSATGRELAWQSRHDDGCAGALSEAWNFCDVVHVNDVGGDRWQSEHSCGTAGVVDGAAFLQMTASFLVAVNGRSRTAGV